MAPAQVSAIADLKAQFEQVLAQWHIKTREAEPVRVHDASSGLWYLDVQMPGFVNCRLTPPRALWLASWQVSTKVPELWLTGANYRGEHRLVVVAEWQRSFSLSSMFTMDFLTSIVDEPVSPFSDPARQIALKRSVRAILKILREAGAEAVEEAANQSSDVGVIAKALEQPQALETLVEEDPLAEAKLRGVKARERLLSEEGGTWSVEAVAKHLQLTRQAVNRRRKLGTLLGLDAGRHGFLYPAWQFDRKGTIHGLEQVLHAMSHLGPWMQHSFMLGQSLRLGDKRGIDVLRQGDVAAVVKAGSCVGEHGAA